jgi:antirestriction protein ArdC
VVPVGCILKDDKRAIFTAASHAQKAADYLHALQPQTGTTSADDLQEAA